MKVHELFETSVINRYKAALQTKPVNSPGNREQNNAAFKKSCYDAQIWFRGNVQPSLTLFGKQRVMEFKDMYELHEFLGKTVYGNEFTEYGTDSYLDFKDRMKQLPKTNPTGLKQLHYINETTGALRRFSIDIQNKLDKWFDVIKPNRGHDYNVLVQYALEPRQTEQLDTCLQISTLLNHLYRFFKEQAAHSA